MQFPDPAQRWPVPEAISTRYIEGMQEHRVVVQHCEACDTWLPPGEWRCGVCGVAEPTWREASGRGAVHTFSVVHRAFHPVFEALVPYVVAVVELEEGPRLMTNLVGCEPEAVRIGLGVEACFETIEGREVLQFRPRD